MAKKKQGGKVRQHRQRPGKRLGVKVSGGQKVHPGMILVRQRGTKFHAGDNVRVGRDHTLYTIAEGKVEFRNKKGVQYTSVH